MKYAYELAERGFVTLAPDYPSLGEHAYDFAPQHGYHSGTMKAVWDNVRAVDLLETLPFVDSQRIGVMGHSLGGHNAIFTALMDERLRVIVSSCGFSSFAKDDVPSWTGPRYLPRLAKQYGNEAACIPFDFPELIAALAPRPFLAVAATRDDDFDVSGVRDCLAAARPVYELHRAATRLQGLYPEAPHSFPDEARKQAYDFLQRELVDRQPVGRKLNHSGGPAVSELKRDEQVVVFPAVAAWNKETRQWQAPLRAWVFESRANGLRERALIELISTTLDLKDEQETRTLRERLAPFVADDEDGKRLVLKLEGNEFALPKTGEDGHAMVQVQWPDEEGPHRSRTRVKRVDVVMPDGDERGFFADVHCIPEQGVSVISDIDDTIKHSHVLDRKELLRNTFLRPFQAVPGMADRYRAWDARGDVAWHFVSASPWQLYGPLSDWAIAERFPPASFHLRTVRLGNVDLWKSLGESQDYKLTTIESLMKAFPKRQFVLVGDTGEKDPEVYGEIARRFPRQIIAIYLREVRPEPQDVSRFEAALRDVPPERWRIFREPSDLPSMIVP